MKAFITRATCVALLLSTHAFAQSSPPDKPDDNPIRPDLQVKGSTSGDGKASLALAFWFLRPVPAGAGPNYHPSSCTLAIDASAETKDGLGQLISGSSGDGPAFKAPVTWSLGVSLGVVANHSASDLFGPNAFYMPQASTLQSMNQAIRTCEAVCTDTSKGCDKFKQFTSTVTTARNDNWLQTNVLTEPITAEGVVARAKALLPAPGAQCSAAHVELGKPIKEYVEASAEMKGVKRTALATAFIKAAETCNAECKAPLSPECMQVVATTLVFKSIKQVTAEEAFPDPDNDLCDAAKPIYRGESRDVEAARYQRYKFAFGGSIGFTPHDYLAQKVGDDGAGLVVDAVDSTGAPTGATLPQLEEKKKTYGRWKGGFSGAYLPLNGMTLEGRATYEGNADAQSTKTEWCEPKGVVGDTSMSPKANACRTLPFGAPDRTHKVSLDAYIGFADLRKGLYRVAIGPQYTVSRPSKDDAVTTHTLGVLMPFSLNLLAAPRNEQKLDYDGLVRLTTYYQAKFEGDKRAVHSFGVILELLGKRSLFSTKYDEL